MTITDFPHAVRPFFAMEERIAYHSVAGSGRVLDGITYDREARLEPLGTDILPFIQPVDYVYEEKMFAGIADIPNRVGNVPVVTEGIVTFFVAGRREYGLCQRSTADAEDGKGVTEWCSRLMDALDRKVSNSTADAFLEGTLAKPMMFKVRENYISDLSFVLLVEVSVYTVPYYRGTRSTA